MGSNTLQINDYGFPFQSAAAAVYDGTQWVNMTDWGHLPGAQKTPAGAVLGADENGDFEPIKGRLYPNAGTPERLIYNGREWQNIDMVQHFWYSSRINGHGRGGRTEITVPAAEYPEPGFFGLKGDLYAVVMQVVRVSSTQMANFRVVNGPQFEVVWRSPAFTRPVHPLVPGARTGFQRWAIYRLVNVNRNQPLQVDIGPPQGGVTPCAFVSMYPSGHEVRMQVNCGITQPQRSSGIALTLPSPQKNDNWHRGAQIILAGPQGVPRNTVSNLKPTYESMRIEGDPIGGNPIRAKWGRFAVTGFGGTCDFFRCYDYRHGPATYNPSVLFEIDGFGRRRDLPVISGINVNFIWLRNRRNTNANVSAEGDANRPSNQIVNNAVLRTTQATQTFTPPPVQPANQITVVYQPAVRGGGISGPNQYFSEVSQTTVKQPGGVVQLSFTGALPSPMGGSGTPNDYPWNCVRFISVTIKSHELTAITGVTLKIKQGGNWVTYPQRGQGYGYDVRVDTTNNRLSISFRPTLQLKAAGGRTEFQVVADYTIR